MQDKNGATIKAGDIVQITGAYFKNDNGFWLVEQDGTNPAYLGKDLTLIKVGKTGKVSQARYNLAFYPLKSYTNDRAKRAEADQWNKEHAQIQIADGISKAGSVEYFEEKLNEHREQARYYEDRGYGEDWIKPHKQNIEYLTGILVRIR